MGFEPGSDSRHTPQAPRVSPCETPVPASAVFSHFRACLRQADPHALQDQAQRGQVTSASSHRHPKPMFPRSQSWQVASELQLPRPSLVSPLPSLSRSLKKKEKSHPHFPLHLLSSLLLLLFLPLGSFQLNTYFKVTAFRVSVRRVSSAKDESYHKSGLREAKGSLCLTNHILLPTTLQDGHVIIGPCFATAQAQAPCSSSHELCSLRTGDLSRPSSNDPERQGLSLSPFVRMGPREVV